MVSRIEGENEYDDFLWFLNFIVLIFKNLDMVILAVMGFRG